MRTLIIIGAIIIAFLIFSHWFARTPPAKIRSVLKKSGLFVLAGILLLLVLTGRAHWLFAVIGGALPFLQRLASAWKTVQFFKKFQNQWKSGDNAMPGATGASRIETRHLRMELDHHTGAMTGIVLSGAYAGRQLADLDFATLLQLLQSLQGARDQDSVRLLESYLLRHHADDWHEYQTQEPQHERQASGESSTMSITEALSMLGLESGADKRTISAAHKRLIQKLHPDRGGTDYLAAKINQAKDVLMKNLKQS